MPRRLSLQLILSLTLILIIVSGITGYINVKREEKQIIQAMIEGAEQLSRSITSATWHAMLADHREDAYAIMQTIADEQGIDRIRYFNKEGDITFSTRPGDASRVDIEAEACALCHATREPLVKVDMPSRARIYDAGDGSRKLGMITPIYNEPSCSDADCHAHPEEINVLGVLDVSLDLDHLDKEIEAAQIRNIVTMGINALFIGIFIFLFTRKFVDAPIKKLIEGTRAVSNMELDRPIYIDSNVELGELARSFNIMRERLAEAIEEINQFTQNLEQKVEERTQQLALAHQKLVQSDRLASLGQLAASVAHEINNPLYSMLNLSKLMQRIITDDGIPPERLPDFKKYLSHVVNETSRVGHLVTDLLAFSRRTKPQRAKTNLNDIIATTVSLLDHKLKLMNVSLKMELNREIPIIECDGSQIQQVVMNLIINGAEATQSSEIKEVTVSTANIPGKNAVRLRVNDTGEGIPEEIVKQMYDPFFTTKSEGKGIGLGLAVVYGIVQAHRGEIEVQTTVGKGTSFSILIPVKAVDGDGEPILMPQIKSGHTV